MPKQPQIAITAKALAQVIMQEMTFPMQPRTGDKRRLVNRLYDEVPKRDDQSFQKQDGEPTPKLTLGQDLTADEEEMFKLFFCIFHGEFVSSAGVDIDHVFSFNKIRQKQIKLLGFLNSDQAFADIFLSQVDIDEYFRRDPADGRVKGTGYFFKLCYNDIGNLLLMCHACNIRKGTADPLDWFEKQEIYFGKPFVKAVMDAGGLQEGVILAKIYHPDNEQTTLDIVGKEINLHGARSQGLGRFAQEWFCKRFQSVLDVNKQFYKEHYKRFQETSDEMRLLLIGGKNGEAHKAHNRLLKTLVSLQGVYDACNLFYKAQESSSGSDDSADKEMRQGISIRHGRMANEVSHELKKIKDLLAEHYDAIPARSFQKRCIKYHDTEMLTGQKWHEIFDELDEYLLEARGLGNTPSVSQVNSTIARLYNVRSESGIQQQAEEDRRLKEAAELREQEATQRAQEESQRAQKATQGEQEAIQRAQDEYQRAQELVATNAALVATIEKLKAVQPQPRFITGGHAGQGDKKRPADEMARDEQGEKKPRGGLRSKR